MEFDWCGTKLFLGAVYWPPDTNTTKVKGYNKYEKQVQQTLHTMNYLNNFGMVILHGDPNARMATAVVKSSDDNQTNKFGEIWIRLLKTTKWRPVPNSKNEVNKFTYKNISDKLKHQSVLDHTFMDQRDMELITHTGNIQLK